MKYVGKTEYQNVYELVQRGITYFRAAIINPENKCRCVRHFRNKREAAKWYDLKLIEYGKEPVNILKRLSA